MTDSASRELGAAGDVDALVRTLLGDLADVEPDRLDADATMEALDVDSLDAGEFLSMVEEELGIDIDIRSLAGDWSRMTVADVCARVRQEMGS